MPALKVDLVVNDFGFLEKLEQLSGVFIPKEMENSIEEIMDEVVSQAQSYPPETDANQPPPPYYVRGTGYVNKFGVQDNASEDLRNQWRTILVGSGDMISGVILNRASYSKAVHNDPQDPEPPHQQAFHGARGWPIIQDLVKAQLGEDTSGPNVSGTGARDRLRDLAGRIADFLRR